MKIKTSIFATILALNSVFLTGNINNIDSYATTIDKNETIDKWEARASMPTNRSSLTSAVVDGKIYCIGGRNGSSSSSGLNRVEVYDPATDSWESKASISVKNYGLTSEVVDGKIYVMGGYDGSSYLDTLQVYNPETNKWETKASMPTSRAYLTSTVVDGKIYCIGGFNGYSLNTVEVYDPTTDSWETKTSILTDKYNLTSEVVDGKIYCVGGYQNGYFLDTIDVCISNINKLEYMAEQAVVSAEDSRETDDIEDARNLVNQLPEGDLKQELQERLNAINTNLALDIKNATANIDVYIKSENMLLMSLSTNSIAFEDYSGTEDIEKSNALTVNINSSLPYDLNVYLVSEIQNADGSNKIDIDRLNIKDSKDVDYKEFAGVNQKLTLKSNCNSGNDLTHDIDLKLKGSQAFKADTYKTVIKFEAEQK